MLRKSLIVLILMTAAFAAGSALAASADDARHFADNVGKQVLATVNASGSEAQKKQQLQSLFSQDVDIDWMGQFVLGHAGKSATPDQHSRFMQDYRKYLLERYTANLRDYSGSKYTITNVTDNGNGEFSVHMKINSPNSPDQKETDAGYTLQAQGGQFKIHDIIIEGVSLITTQRSEYASVMGKGGIDMLISDLEKKNQGGN